MRQLSARQVSCLNDLCISFQQDKYPVWMIYASAFSKTSILFEWSMRQRSARQISCLNDLCVSVQQEPQSSEHFLSSANSLLYKTSRSHICIFKVHYCARFQVFVTWHCRSASRLTPSRSPTCYHEVPYSAPFFPDYTATNQISIKSVSCFKG
jgi:hypothetical protein